jgi:hypothetical protein
MSDLVFHLSFDGKLGTIFYYKSSLHTLTKPSSPAVAKRLEPRSLLFQLVSEQKKKKGRLNVRTKIHEDLNIIA